MFRVWGGELGPPRAQGVGSTESPAHTPLRGVQARPWQRPQHRPRAQPIEERSAGALAPPQGRRTPLAQLAAGVVTVAGYSEPGAQESLWRALTLQGRPVKDGTLEKVKEKQKPNVRATPSSHRRLGPGTRSCGPTEIGSQPGSSWKTAEGHSGPRPHSGGAPRRTEARQCHKAVSHKLEGSEGPHSGDSALWYPTHNSPEHQGPYS